MSDLRVVLGARKLRETVAEQTLPVLTSAASWYVASLLLTQPSASRPLAGLELFLVLGAVAASFSWMVSRQLVLLNIRRPRLIVGWAIGSSFLALATLTFTVVGGFEDACAELGGTVDLAHGVFLSSGAQMEGLVCRLGSVPDNAYLPGPLLRAPWDGWPGPWLVVSLVATSVLTSVGTRDLRLRPTRIGLLMAEELNRTSAAGWKAVYEGSDAREVQACGNPTLWGEPCAQLYDAEREFQPGEWCVRCNQVYRRADRTLTFTVVSLFTGDVDVLNGLERLDATSWPPDRPQPPDARLSGQERWVRLGQIEVPEVISVATLLQLVQGKLRVWAKEARPEDLDAFELAASRASRLSCWFWVGFEEHELTYARPSERALLGVGATRLRDLPLDAGQRLALQLDIGLLPLELRTGYRQTFLEAGRPPLLQNLKQDIWVPVAPPKGIREGLWVPRIEGAALRAWLALDRLRPDDARGVVSPRPYVFPGDPVEDEPLPEGRLDLVRTPVVDRAPVRENLPGASIAEWAWADERLIELLRQQALVLVRT